jgi:hypothetical protein
MLPSAEIGVFKEGSVTTPDDGALGPGDGPGMVPSEGVVGAAGPGRGPGRRQHNCSMKPTSTP